MRVKVMSIPRSDSHTAADVTFGVKAPATTTMRGLRRVSALKVGAWTRRRDRASSDVPTASDRPRWKLMKASASMSG